MVDPTFDFLLSTPSAYVPGKEAVELLFTEKFLESMLKEATQDATLANSAAARERAQAGRRKAASHPSQSSRVLRPRKADVPQSYPDGRQNDAGRKARTTTRSWLSGGDRYVNKKVICSIKSVAGSIHAKSTKAGCDQVADFV